MRVSRPLRAWRGWPTEEEGHGSLGRGILGVGMDQLVRTGIGLGERLFNKLKTRPWAWACSDGVLGRYSRTMT